MNFLQRMSGQWKSSLGVLKKLMLFFLFFFYRGSINSYKRFESFFFFLRAFPRVSFEMF